MAWKRFWKNCRAFWVRQRGYQWRNTTLWLFYLVYSFICSASAGNGSCWGTRRWFDQSWRIRWRLWWCHNSWWLFGSLFQSFLGRRGYGYYSPYGSSSVIENYVLVGASVGGAAILSLVKRKKTNEPEGMIYSLKFLVIKRKRKNCLTKSNRLFCDPNRLGSRCTWKIQQTLYWKTIVGTQSSIATE